MAKLPELIEEPPTFIVKGELVFWTEGDVPKCMSIATFRRSLEKANAAMAAYDRKSFPRGKRIN